MKLNNASAKNLKKLRQCIRTEVAPIINQINEKSLKTKSPSKQKLARTACSFSIVQSNGSRIKQAQSNIIPTSPRKIKHLQKEIQTQRHSIKFYLTQLNRKQTMFRQNLQKYQSDCSQQVQSLQSLIKGQAIKKNRISKQLDKQNRLCKKFGAIYNDLDNEQLFKLYEDIRYELYKRGLKHHQQANTTQSQSQIKKIKLFKQNSFSLDGVSNITQ